MLPDRVSNPGLLTYESGALPIALRGPAMVNEPTVFEPLKFYCMSIFVILFPPLLFCRFIIIIIIVIIIISSILIGL